MTSLPQPYLVAASEHQQVKEGVMQCSYGGMNLTAWHMTRQIEILPYAALLPCLSIFCPFLKKRKKIALKTFQQVDKI